MADPHRDVSLPATTRGAPPEPEVPADIAPAADPFEAKLLEARASLALHAEVQRRRYWGGVVTMGLAVALVLLTLYYGHNALSPLLGQAVLPDQLAPFLTIVIGHVVISAAGVLFAYQLFRAGERLLVPLHMAQNRPELLIGVQSPDRTALQFVQEVRKMVHGEDEA